MSTIVALLGALVLMLTEAQASAQGAKETNALQLKLPTQSPQRPKGIRALEIKPGRVPFTTNDVALYVQTHRLAKSVGDLSQLRVESLELITARELTTRLQGVSTGLPSRERVGFAIIRGPIYFTGPRPGKPVEFERGYVVFDASTGNLLMSGSLRLARE